MKAFLYKLKGALALALAMSLCSTQVFAADALSAEKQGVQVAPVQETKEEEAAPLPTLTYEEALEKAKKHSPTLRDIQATDDFLQETKEDLWDSVGYFNNVNYDYQKWVNDGWWAVTSAAFSTDLGMQKSSLGRKIQNLALEATVKSTFTSIKSSLDTLELTRKNAEIQKELFRQGQAKYKLGLLSKYNLDQLEIAANQAADNVSQLEASLEQTYIQLNNLMGEKTDARFNIEYEVDYEPYEMKQSMEQYVNDKINGDLTIQLKELDVENAKFNKNYLKESSTGSEQNQNDMSYDSAKRALKTAKEEKEVAIRNAYLQLEQLETKYSTDQSALTKAQADLRAAEVNYQAGNTTKITVEQAKLGVLQAENTLKQDVLNHDMLIFTFENPSLLGGGGSTAAAQ